MPRDILTAEQSRAEQSNYNALPFSVARKYCFIRLDNAFQVWVRHTLKALFAFLGVIHVKVEGIVL